MKKIVFGIAAVAAGLGVASSVLAGSALAAKPAAPAVKPTAAGAAAPKKARVWINHMTVAFEHKLPSTWSLLDKERRDASNPTVGSWRFASLNGHSKMFIRISELKEGGIKEAFERALPLLGKQLDKVKEVARMVLPLGPGKHPAGILFVTGNAAVKNRTTKAVEGSAHLVARYFKQLPEYNRQVSITYLFAAGKDSQLESFMREHLGYFSLHDPVAIAKELIKAAKEDPRPVVKPVAPPAAKLKAAIKALGKDADKVIKAPSKAIGTK